MKLLQLLGNETFFAATYCRLHNKSSHIYICENDELPKLKVENPRVVHSGVSVSFAWKFLLPVCPILFPVATVCSPTTWEIKKRNNVHLQFIPISSFLRYLSFPFQLRFNLPKQRNSYQFLAVNSKVELEKLTLQTLLFLYHRRFSGRRNDLLWARAV